MIRKLMPSTNEDDFSKLLRAYLEIWNTPDSHEYLTFTGQSFTEEIVADWLHGHQEAGVDYYASFDKQGSIRGICVIRVDPIHSFSLLGLGVHPNSRRQGIGSALVIHVVQTARQLDYRAVDTDVYADNKHMLRLVLDLDFIPVRLTHNARYDGGDLVHLKRYLEA